MKDPTSQLSRIRLDLEKYNFKIQYVAGNSNYADSISRISIEQPKDLYIDNSHILTITIAQTRKESTQKTEECTRTCRRTLEKLDKLKTR